MSKKENTPEKKDSLEEKLGISLNRNMVTIDGETGNTEVANYNEEVVHPDVEVARRTYRGVIDKATSASEDLYEIAFSSQHPRAYEVLARLLDTVLSAGKCLEDSVTEKSTKKKSDGPSEINIDKGVVFSGSSSELLDKIDRKKK